MFRPGETARVKTTMGFDHLPSLEAGTDVEILRLFEGLGHAHAYWVRLPSGDEVTIDESSLYRPYSNPEEEERVVNAAKLRKLIEARAAGEKTEDTRSPEEVAEATRRMELRDRFEEAIGNIPAKVTDWNGHYKDGEWWNTVRLYGQTAEEYVGKEIKQSVLFLRMEVLDGGLDEAERIIDLMESGEALETPIKLGGGFGTRFECPYCGKTLVLHTDGQSFFIGGDRCGRPEGLEFAEWELNVPSGKLVVANDLRTWFPADKDYDVNKLIGCHLQTMDYAAVGMSHGFVGNTCPSVYKDGDRFLVANWPDEIEDPEKPGEYEYIENPEKCPWGEAVASVVTDLWWYSIVDYDELVRRWEFYTPDGDFEKFLGEWHRHVVEVKPGVYRFRHYHEVDRDAPTVVYADFEWVRDPDPLVDYIAQEEDKEFSAEMVLAQHIRDWPSLYVPRRKERGDYDDRKTYEECTDEEKMHAVARAADQIMCTNGNGIDWHPNGFPRTVVSPDTKPVEIPAFTGRLHWYPMSPGFSTITRAAGLLASGGYRSDPEDGEANMHPSFVALALNICQNIVSYGLTTRLSDRLYPPTYDVKYKRKEMHQAARCYWNLRKKYPDVVFDEDFDTWMQAKTRVKEWIDRFDLGPLHPPKETWPEPPPTEKTGEYFEFDASKIEDGHFCWHPRNPGVAGCWASKENAQRYALDTYKGTTEEGDESWYCHAGTSIPLHAVGRVVGPGMSINVGPILEVAFEFGTDEMTDGETRWAVPAKVLQAVRQFNGQKTYSKLLAKCKAEYEEQEAAIDKAREEYGR